MSKLAIKKQKEESLHASVAQYLKLQYPNVLFRTDYAAGMKMTIGQAMKHKKMQCRRAWPDLFIAEPRGKWSGLFLELKKEGTTIFKKDGTLRKDEHLEEQCEVLNILKNKGYSAEFAIGFDQAKNIIYEYMKLK